MGTHPIFESDFDCLTDRTGPNLPIMTEQMTFKGSLKGHNGWVTQIATTPIFPDMLLSSSRDKTIIMWHLTREEGSYGVPKRRMQGHSHFVSDVEVSSDGQYALSGSWDATLRLWDLASGNTVRRFVGHTKDVLSVSFSPDNRRILSAALGPNHQALEHRRCLQVHHPGELPHRVGFLRPILSPSPDPSHRLCRLGQACQGLEPYQLQAEARLPRPHWLPQHRQRLPRRFPLRFRRPRRPGQALGHWIRGGQAPSHPRGW